MKTITVTNQKGGVGKTTTALMLSEGLSRKGHRVLAIDSDPQGNLSYTARVESSKSALYSIFTGELETEKAISKSALGFDCITGGKELSRVELEFNETGREYLLREILDPIKEEYDYCIIDTPPTLSLLTVNALTASDSVIIPMSTDAYSLQGLDALITLIGRVRKYSNPSLEIDGILLIKYNSRSIMARQIKDQLGDIARGYGTRLYDSTIREAVAIREAQFLKKGIFSDNAKSNVKTDCNNFINEVLKGE